MLYAALGVRPGGRCSRACRAAAEAAPAERAGAPGALRRPVGLASIARRRWCKLSALFALDSFGGGFVVQSFAAYWFYLRFGVDPARSGAVLRRERAGRLLGAGRAAARRAHRPVNTMVATHLPSNVLLILVPLMPTLPLAIAVLLLRFSISQMDVPTRQSYTMAVVAPTNDRRRPASPAWRGRSGAAISPLFAGLLFARPAGSTCRSSSPAR